MTTSEAIGRIDASDEELRRALDDAFLPALLPALAQATGDLSILQDDLLPERIMPGGIQAGMTDEQQARARDLAFDALVRLRDHGAAEPGTTDILPILRWVTRGEATAEYLPLLIEELDPANDDPRAPRWQMEAGTQFSAATEDRGDERGGKSVRHAESVG